MFMMTSFVVRFYFYFHDVLGACFEIRDEPYGGRLVPTLTVGPNIRLYPYLIDQMKADNFFYFCWIIGSTFSLESMLIKPCCVVHISSIWWLMGLTPESFLIVFISRPNHCC